MILIRNAGARGGMLSIIKWHTCIKTVYSINIVGRPIMSFIFIYIYSEVLSTIIYHHLLMFDVLIDPFPRTFQKKHQTSVNDDR